MTAMETVDIFKALANDTRLTILMWLKEPEKEKSQNVKHTVGTGASFPDRAPQL